MFSSVPRVVFLLVPILIGVTPTNIHTIIQVEQVHQVFLTRERNSSKQNLSDPRGRQQTSKGEYTEEGKYIEELEEAFKLSLEIGDLQAAAHISAELGITYFALEEHDSAIEAFQFILDIEKQIEEDSDIISLAYNNLGNIYSSLEQHEESVQYYLKGLSLDQREGDFIGQGTTYYNLGLAYFDIGRFEESAQAFRDSIYAYENIEDNFLPEEQISWSDEQIDIFNMLQRSLISQNKYSEALVFAERGRARYLNEFLMDRFFFEELKDADHIRQEIENPTIESLVQASRDHEATLVVYTIVRYTNEIIVWVIQPDGHIRNRLIALEENSFESLTNFVSINPSRGDSSFHSLINSARGIDTEAGNENTSLETLYDLLIEPIKAWLPNDANELVIFIPQLELFKVPFAALQDSRTGKYLIEEHTISISPSVFTLKLTVRRQGQIENLGNEALIIGNPTLSDYVRNEYMFSPLDGAEAESNAIARLLDVNQENLLLNENATKSAIMKNLNSFKYIHFATHGLFENLRIYPPDHYAPVLPSAYEIIPGFLAIAPSAQDPKGQLTAQEIYEYTLNYPLNANMVVLSACQTGHGYLSSGGPFGLPYAFLLAGTPSIVVSLWNISDGGTQFLMEEFYYQLLESEDIYRLNKSHALRQAMLSTMEEYPDPKTWGAFVLIGQP
mgnify:CR=1 FL=1